MSRKPSLVSQERLFDARKALGDDSEMSQELITCK